MDQVLAVSRTFKPAGSRSGLVQIASGPKQTTDATTTKILSIPVAELESIGFEGLLVGTQSDYSDQITVKISGGARRATAGNVTLTGTTTVTILESDVNTNATVTADTTNQNVDINAVGVAAQTWNWEFFGTKFSV